MKVLLVNKFLYPHGGSETYILKIGAWLQAHGHEVQYFGMDDPRRCLSNAAGAYTDNMDFHDGRRLAKLTYPVRTVYSAQARKKLRLVLEDFAPDVCHLNNFHYQLTPSILLELRKWRAEGHACRVLYTAHDFQLICPNHMLFRPQTGTLCEVCIGGHFGRCAKGRCIHGSLPKSLIGTAEAVLWNRTDVYDTIDTILCCSDFMRSKIDTNQRFAAKTVTLHNFAEKPTTPAPEKEAYVLYFGRFSAEKGTDILLEACRRLPQIPFVFAGTGPLAEQTAGLTNVKNVGFLTGEDLTRLIRAARFSVYPPVLYENCPFSVLESQVGGTPVLGTAIGGIPELIEAGRTGELVPPGDADALTAAIESLWNDPARLARYTQGCETYTYESPDAYGEKLLKLYNQS